MTKLLYLLIVLVGLIAGAGLAAQPGVNGFLAKRMVHPLHASIISFAVGLGILVTLSIFSGQFPPRFSSSPFAIPWWAWAGGAIGAYVVSTSLFFAPRIGALQWVVLVLTAQALTSLLLDHFALVGFDHRPITPARSIGAALVVLGLILCSKGSFSKQNLPSIEPVEATSSDSQSHHQ